jgi:general secretion pathway protein I
LRKSTRAGFTLIEVLVALAIAALGIASLIAATGVGLGSADLAAQYVNATRRAQSRLDTVGILQPFAAGEQSGDDGGGFFWRVRISPPATHLPQPGSGDLPGLYQVEVDIDWRSGLGWREVSLRSERLGPLPGSDD